VSTVARPAAVRRKVEEWLARPDGSDAIALRARPEWDGDETLAIGDVTVRVVPCRTALAARAALHERDGDERLVLLTELSEDELGDALLSRLSRQQVRSIDRWDLVRQVFGGVELHPGLVATGRWAADALVDHAPADGWPTPPGVLTRDHALGNLAAQLLGLPREQVDSAGLLQWSTDPAALMHFTSLPTDTLDGLTAYLTEVAGSVAVPVMAAVRAGNGVDAVPLGLLVGALWPAGGGELSPQVAMARARLEPYLGGLKLTDAQSYAYRDAAEAWIDRAIDSGETTDAHRLLDRAETIAAQMEITELLTASSMLPSGLRQRLRQFAAAVRYAVPAPGATADPMAVAGAQAALAKVCAHRAATRPRVDTARMAVRLLRWLATADGAAPATLHEAVQRHVHADGWVDRARLDIFAGDPDADPDLAKAYRRLHQAVDTRRARHDERFAELLAQVTADDAEPGQLLRVEDLLDRVVQPIVDRGRRVLLLVLDGMGMAAATELAESVVGSWPWLEMAPKDAGRAGVLAALPTVTEVSRCSLLSGRIAVGSRAEEQKAFQQRYPDGMLLHKEHLRSGAGEALDDEVRAALDNPDVPVVAAVINTIDDALDRSDPGTAVWTIETVRGISQLLARAQDRVVVVTSDHGHVVDRGSDAVVLPSTSNENRWRPADPPPADGEVVVAGRRVALGGGEVVLPWREEVRYGPRKAGYHGGVSPAEAVIPLLVFSAGDEQALPGWGGAPVARPAWWSEPLADTPPEPVRPPAATRPSGRRRRPEPAQETALFEDVWLAPSDTAAAARPSLVEALLASEVYAQRRDARATLDDERVAAMLEVLVAGGRRATMDTLAAGAGVPQHRMNTVVTALRKLLNVEGFAVLDIDDDGRTVKLNEPLLREQFGLGGA
jgi:hypothetical protein